LGEKSCTFWVEVVEGVLWMVLGLWVALLAVMLQRMRFNLMERRVLMLMDLGVVLVVMVLLVVMMVVLVLVLLVLVLVLLMLVVLVLVVLALVMLMMLVVVRLLA